MSAALDFDPRSPEFRRDPYPTYAELRRQHPVWRRPGREDWVLTRFEDIVQVLRSDGFGHAEAGIDSSAERAPAEGALSYLRRQSQLSMAHWLVLRNPPAHTRLRKLMRPHFSPARVASLREAIQARVDELISSVSGRSLDLVQDFAYPLTFGTNCGLIGIPEDDLPRGFRRWAQAISAMTDLDVTWPVYERGLLAIAAVNDYFREVIASLRSQGGPPQGLLHALVLHDPPLHEEELLAMGSFMLAVGHASAESLIVLSMLTILRHPEQRELLQRSPSLTSAAVAEAMRYDNPIQSVSRTVLKDAEVGGQRLRAGEVVHCLVAAANRDPGRYPDPDRFDIERASAPSLSFGQGIHVCIGMHLARLLAEVSVATLFSRLPTLALGPERLEWDETYLVRGLKRLPVVW